MPLSLWIPNGHCYSLLFDVQFPKKFLQQLPSLRSRAELETCMPVLDAHLKRSGICSCMLNLQVVRKKRRLSVCSFHAQDWLMNLAIHLLYWWMISAILFPSATVLGILVLVFIGVYVMMMMCSAELKLLQRPSGLYQIVYSTLNSFDLTGGFCR